jgi:hypothetical protein
MVAAEVFGQHEEKKEIVSWLTQPDQIKEDTKIVFANHLSIFSMLELVAWGRLHLPNLSATTQML